MIVTNTGIDLALSCQNIGLSRMEAGTNINVVKSLNDKLADLKPNRPGDIGRAKAIVADTPVAYRVMKEMYNRCACECAICVGCAGNEYIVKINEVLPLT